MDAETLTVSVLGTVKRQTALFIRLAGTHYQDRHGSRGVNKTENIKKKKKKKNRERERGGELKKDAVERWMRREEGTEVGCEESEGKGKGCKCQTES